MDFMINAEKVGDGRQQLSISTSAGRELLGTPAVYTETWTIKGILFKEVAVSIATKRAALLTQLNAGISSLAMGTVHTIASTECVEPIKIVSIDYPVGLGVEGDTMLHYTAVFRFKRVRTAEYYTIDTAESIDRQGMKTRTFSGQKAVAYTSTDHIGDVETWLDTFFPLSDDPAKPSKKVSQNVTKASGETGSKYLVVDYTVSYLEPWADMPTDIASQEYSVTDMYRVGSQNMSRYSGRWVGKDSDMAAVVAAYSAATASYSGVNMLSKDYSYDASRGVISVSFVFLNDVRTEIARSDSVSQTFAQLDFVMLPVLNGSVPVRQNTVKRPCTVIQTGYAIGSNSYPSPTTMLYPSDLKRQSTRQSLVYDMNKNIIAYRFDWTFEFLLADNPT